MLAGTLAFAVWLVIIAVNVISFSPRFLLNVTTERERETRTSGHNVATTAKQVTMVWTCVAKG